VGDTFSRVTYDQVKVTPLKNDMSDYQRTARYNTSDPRAINVT